MGYLITNCVLLILGGLLTAQYAFKYDGGSIMKWAYVAVMAWIVYWAFKSNENQSTKNGLVEMVLPFLVIASCLYSLVRLF
jgi:hypothetical protein